MSACSLFTCFQLRKSFVCTNTWCLRWLRCKRVYDYVLSMLLNAVIRWSKRNIGDGCCLYQLALNKRVMCGICTVRTHEHMSYFIHYEICCSILVSISYDGMSCLYSISKKIIYWLSETGRIRISTSIATLLINLDFLKLFFPTKIILFS